MKIALFTADIGNPNPNTGDYFITEGVRTLLSGHNCYRIPLHEPLTNNSLSILETSDLAVLCGSNLIGASPQGGIRLGISREFLLSWPKPLLTLGLGVQQDLGRKLLNLPSQDVDLLKGLVCKGGPLNVRDRFSYEALANYLSASDLVETGCPSFNFKPKILNPRLNHFIFCPGPYHYETPALTRNVVVNLYRNLLKSFATPHLLLIQEPIDLRYHLCEPGNRIIHSPLSPEIHLKAIASSRGMISFRIHPCLMAANYEVPALLVALDERTAQLAEHYHIPHLRYSTNLSASEIMFSFQRVLTNFSWMATKEAIQKSIEDQKKTLSKFIALNAASSINASSSRTLHIACIADRNYLGSLLGLYENIKVHHPSFKMHCLWLDASMPDFPVPENLIFYLSSQVWSDHSKFAKLPNDLKAYTSKAKWMAFLIQKIDQPLSFCDLDLYFFAPIDSLVFKTSYALLFPHWNDSLNLNRKFGLFNAGLIVAHPEAIEFLEWWSTLCERACINNIREGYYYEQGFLDMAPVYFPRIEIYRQMDHNLGVWNQQTVPLTLDPHRPGFLVNQETGEAILSYHATHPDAQYLFAIKYAWDAFITQTYQLPLSKMLHVWVCQYQKKQWPELKRFMFLWNTIQVRTPISFQPFSRQLSKIFVIGMGEPLIRALTYMYWAARWFKNSLRSYRHKKHNLDESLKRKASRPGGLENSTT